MSRRGLLRVCGDGREMVPQMVPSLDSGKNKSLNSRGCLLFAVALVVVFLEKVDWVVCSPNQAEAGHPLRKRKEFALNVCGGDRQDVVH